MNLGYSSVLVKLNRDPIEVFKKTNGRPPKFGDTVCDEQEWIEIPHGSTFQFDSTKQFLRVDKPNGQFNAYYGVRSFIPVLASDIEDKK